MFVNHSVISLYLIFTFCKCQPISDQFQAARRHFSGMSSSEEMYYHNPQQEYYNQPPASYRHIDDSMGPPLYPPMPIARPQPDVIPFDPYHSEGLFPQAPHFQPDVRYGTFENPFKKVLDPMRKDMSDTIKGMNDTMGNQAEEMGKQAGKVGKQFEDAGKEMTEAMQKPAEEIGKQMQDAMDDAHEQFEEHVDSMSKGAEEARASIPFAPTSSSNSMDAKKKLEDAAEKKDGKEDKEELSDVKKKMDENENPIKKMEDSGSKVKKTFPVPGSLVGSIKDETTEAHEDESDFPRAEAMEWAPSHFVDLRYHHPRSGRVFDYYYDGDY